jgi:hypothetical protein
VCDEDERIIERYFVTRGNWQRASDV